MMRPQMKAKTGELWKADPQGRNWKKRFFVLGQGKISYFLSRDAHMSKPDRPKGYFLVADIDDIVIMGPAPAPLARAEKQFRFQIMIRARNMSRVSAILSKLTQALKLPDEVLLAVIDQGNSLVGPFNSIHDDAHFVILFFINASGLRDVDMKDSFAVPVAHLECLPVRRQAGRET